MGQNLYEVVLCSDQQSEAVMVWEAAFLTVPGCIFVISYLVINVPPDNRSCQARDSGPEIITHFIQAL